MLATADAADEDADELADPAADAAPDDPLILSLLLPNPAIV